MQIYMPALLSYFTANERDHLHAGGANFLLRLHIIFSKLTQLGCVNPSEPCKKQVAAFVLLLEFWDSGAHDIDGGARLHARDR